MDNYRMKICFLNFYVGLDTSKNYSIPQMMLLIKDFQLKESWKSNGDSSINVNNHIFIKKKLNGIQLLHSIIL